MDAYLATRVQSNTKTVRSEEDAFVPKLTRVPRHAEKQNMSHTSRIGPNVSRAGLAFPTQGKSAHIGANVTHMIPPNGLAKLIVTTILPDITRGVRRHAQNTRICPLQRPISGKTRANTITRCHELGMEAPYTNYFLTLSMSITRQH